MVPIIWIFLNKLKETNESILLGRLIKKLVFNQKKKTNKKGKNHLNLTTPPPPLYFREILSQTPFLQLLYQEIHPVQYFEGKKN